MSKENGRRIVGGLALCLVLVAIVVWRARRSSDKTSRPDSVLRDTAADRGNSELDSSIPLAPSDSAGRDRRERDQQETRVEGRAITVDGTPAAGGRVFAWRAGHAPSMDQLLQAQQGMQSQDVSTSDVANDGSFSMTGLNRGWTYAFVAFVPGAVTRSPVAGHPGDAAVELVLFFLHGAAFSLSDSSGSQLRAGEGLYGNGPTIQSKGGQPLTPVPMFLHVLGIEGLRTGHTRDRWQFLVTSETPELVEPAVYTIALPGYEKAQVTAPLPRVEIALAEVWVRVIDMAEARGTLVLRTLASDPIIAAAARLVSDAPLGKVNLMAPDRKVIHFGLDASNLWDTRIVRGVPCGEYKIFFTATEGYFDTPPLTVQINDGVTDFTLDLTRASALELVVESDERPYEGMLPATLTGSDGSVSLTLFERPPYLFPLIEPGEYTVASFQSAQAMLDLQSSDKTVLAKATHNVLPMRRKTIERH